MPHGESIVAFAGLKHWGRLFALNLSEPTRRR